MENEEFEEMNKLNDFNIELIDNVGDLLFYLLSNNVDKYSLKLIKKNDNGMKSVMSFTCGNLMVHVDEDEYIKRVGLLKTRIMEAMMELSEIEHKSQD